MNRQALEILKQYGFRVWNMMGPSEASTRQDLMLALTGQRLPKAKCGVSALESIIRSTLKPAQGCIAAQDREMRDRLDSMYRETA